MVGDLSHLIVKVLKGKLQHSPHVAHCYVAAKQEILILFDLSDNTERQPSSVIYVY